MIRRLIIWIVNNLGSEEVEQPDVRLQRTWTNTVFEIVIGVLLLVLWVSIAFKIALSGGQPIPTHFDIAGNADDYGSPYWLLLLGGVNTAVAIYSMKAAYRPLDMIHVNVPIKSMRQVWLIVRWAYVFSIEITLFCISLVYNGVAMMTVFFKVMVVVMVATCLGVTVLLKKYK